MASRIIKVESFLEEFESVSRSRDVRGVVGRETAPSEPPLLNKIESDIFRLELTLTVSFLTDCFGLRCVELNDESFYGFYIAFTFLKIEKNDKTIPLSSSSPIKSDLFGLFDFGVRTDLVGLAVTLYCGWRDAF